MGLGFDGSVQRAGSLHAAVSGSINSSSGAVVVRPSLLSESVKSGGSDDRIGVYLIGTLSDAEGRKGGVGECSCSSRLEPHFARISPSPSTDFLHFCQAEQSYWYFVDF